MFERTKTETITMKMGAVVMFVGMLVAVNAIAQAGCGSGDEAKQEALQYGADLGLEVRGASCTSLDTDGVGYVSCELSYESAGTLHTKPLDCAIRLSFNHGCKERGRKLQILRRQ